MGIDKHIITRIREQENPHMLVGEVCEIRNYKWWFIKFRRVKVLKEIISPITYESEEIKKATKDFVKYEMDQFVKFYLSRQKK